jgi:hypothetical protein
MVAVPANRVGDFVPGPPFRGVSLRPGVKTICLIDAASKVCGVSLCVADAKAHAKKIAERIIWWSLYQFCRFLYPDPG